MRIGLLCPPTLEPWRVAVVDGLVAQDGVSVVGCLVDRSPQPSMRRRLTANLRRGRGGYVLVLALRKLSRSGDDGQDTAAVLARHQIPVVDAPAAYDPGALEALRALEPEVLVLLGGFGIVRRPLLELTPGGVLSYHHGDMRRYRGQPPGFWEVYNGERSVGVTVQRLDESLDGGQPLVERSYEIGPGETPAALRARLLDGSADMMPAAVRLVQRGDDEQSPLDRLGDLYTLPNGRQWLVCHARVARRALRQRLSDRRR